MAVKKVLIYIICVASFILVFSGCDSKQTVDISEKKIQNICELSTLKCKYHNVARDVKNAGKGVSHWGEIDRKFWVEYTVEANVGVDFSKVYVIDVDEDKGVVKIYIPSATLLGFENIQFGDSIESNDAKVNKNPIEFEDKSAAVDKAQLALTDNIMNNTTIMTNAQNRAKMLVENYISIFKMDNGSSYKVKWVYDQNSNEVGATSAETTSNS